MKPPSERSATEQAIASEVINAWCAAQEQMFLQIERLAELYRWPAETVRDAIEHYCGDEIADTWDEFLEDGAA